MAILAESGGASSKPLTQAEIAAGVAAAKAQAEAAQTNAAARRSTEAYASPFSTAFGGTAPSTAIDAVRQYASPFSTAFGGSAPATPYTPSQMVGPTGTYTGSAAAPATGGSTGGSTGGDTPTGGGDTGKKTVDTGVTQETRDAFATMGLLLQQWGLEGLADTYSRLMTMGLSAGEALTKLKYDKSIDPVTGKPWNTAYNTRFKGNELRVAAGMNAYDEGTYLEVENAYDETLRKYGLVNLIQPDKSKAQAQYADYMAKGLAPVEFADRIQTVADRVINMDPTIKEQFQAYYPSLTNTDIVSYFLDPKQTLPVLKNKVTAAEIGAVAKTTGYAIGEERAMGLAQYGVSRADALAGYQQIGEVLPTATKLSSIYNEEGIDYGQTAAEDEYLKQDARAKLKRNRLASKERAMFSGDSGTNTNSLSRSDTGVF